MENSDPPLIAEHVYSIFDSLSGIFANFSEMKQLFKGNCGIKRKKTSDDTVTIKSSNFILQTEMTDLRTLLFRLDMTFNSNMETFSELQKKWKRYTAQFSRFEGSFVAACERFALKTQ